jgi:pimeloyl-ACP methyl ester carboxylesterase
VKDTEIDVIEAGQGPLVVLLHSSVAGARQWRRLSERLAGAYHVKAVNLFGYGRTPAWHAAREQTLAVAAVVPEGTGDVALVGHSFGGAVAMQVAASLGRRVSRVVLIEPNPFSILRDHGRTEAFAEAVSLRDIVKQFGGSGEWAIAAERFADYWGGEGTWNAMGQERRAAFVEGLKPNFHEWDAVMSETTSLQDWVEHLPASTLVLHDVKTVRPIREIVALMGEATPWLMKTVPQGGHMAPLTHPELVNPLVADFLDGK